MNRLIIIGNGFDLAHGKKTDYKSFIFWYIKKCLIEAFENPNHIYEDIFLHVENQIFDPDFNKYGDKIKDISSFIDFFLPDKISDLLNSDIITTISGKRESNIFRIQIVSEFFRNLFYNCINKNWVDIENEYYSNLLKLSRKVTHSLPGNYFSIEDLHKLNTEMSKIIIELENYLKEIDKEVLVPEYNKIFDPKENPVNYIYILNFNYTTTPEYYLPPTEINFENIDQKIVEHNYIHGKLGDKLNKPIFGFGDELDKEYVNIELLNINDFFNHIKSFWYFKTPNYQNLAKFIDQGEYEIYLLGHSCGLSDRTMLNMIFENKYCLKIKIFYHGNKDGFNNYTDLTHNISRHFKDKAAMRLKIVPFTESQRMPQFNDKVDN